MTERAEDKQAPSDRSLDTKILRGSGWIALSFGGKNVASMLSTLVLVRLLEPKAFGLVALASTFVIVLENIQGSGLGSALIFTRHDLEAAVASALAFTAIASMALYGVVYAVAPLFAGVFDDPALTDVVRVLGILLVIRGLSVGPGAMLEREMNFRSRAKGELSGALTNVTVSITLAFLGAGVWSLVAGSLAASVVATTVFWILAPWRPSLRQASWPVLLEMLRYGRHVSAGNLITLFSRTVDNLAVGRLLNTTALGFYAVTFRLADFPTAVIGHVVGRVMFSAYSILQDDAAGFRRAYVHQLQRVALLAIPLGVTVLVAAEPIVLGLLGEEWGQVITPLRILAGYSLVRNFAATSGAIFMAKGKPYLVPLLALPHVCVVLPALILLIPRFGLSGAAIATLVAFSASGIPSFVVAMRLVELKARELVRALWSALVCSLILALALALVIPASEGMTPVASLVLVAVVGTVVYLGAIAVFARSTVVPMWISLRGSRT
jgi:lipopolysaccharide exporter